MGGGGPNSTDPRIQAREAERRRQAELERMARGRTSTVLSGPSASAVGQPLIVGN